MLNKAKLNFPYLNFTEVEKVQSLSVFDLVFSSFVLFELSTKNEIINYLNVASSFLRNEDIFFGITGSQNLHQKKRDWMCFNIDFEENLHPESGDVIKLELKEPCIEFRDYYWDENDYKECFQLSKLELIQIHYPLRYKGDPDKWKDELLVSPFVIFLAERFTRE